MFINNKKPAVRNSCQLPSSIDIRLKKLRESIPMAQQNRNRDDELLLLFDRPHEPMFLPRQSINGKEVVFDVPADYVDDRYKPIYQELQSRFGTDNPERVTVRASKLPNLSQIKQLDRRENFTLFIPRHRKFAASLIKIFMGAKDKEEFFSVATYARDQINPGLWNYAYSVALLHRPDTKHLPVAPLTETFPNKFLAGEVFSRALAESTIVPEDQRLPIEIPRDYTATDLDVEHRVAYFREDLGINLHHWHWHLVYPFDGTVEIVRKDRRGELFYYMHQQIIARYNLERFCNNLARVKKFNNFREAIPEGYFPKLDSLLGSRSWPPRFSGTTIRDVYREADQIEFEILDLERWRDRIYSAIHGGAIQDNNGRTVQLSEGQGIDILGNIIEASILSPNKNLYGDIHNFGHLAFASCHDPDGRNLEPVGVMGDTATAMRDPIFYRWHAFVDEIFQEHKSTLPRYTAEQLTFPGINVAKIEVSTQGRPANQMHTFWQQSIIDMQRGLDFYPRGAVLAKFTHLQHMPYNLKITVENSSGAPKTGTARIFLGPKFDERGFRWNFGDHRVMFIELDKFLVTLKNGTSVIERKSTQSSVTIPFERTFRSLGPSNRPDDGNPQAAGFNFCGCGWPQHMLIPKGMEGNGLQCQLFVMISDYNADKVDLPRQQQKSCTDAASYCGLRDSVYPDKRAMGYPFDRPARDGVDRIADFLTANMAVIDVAVIHNNRTVDQSGVQIQDLQDRFGKPQRKPAASGAKPAKGNASGSRWN
ncbi:Phenoloxidase subunit 2 [Nesidiocoris tenuis]|uniref:Phenoloxidase subunit 2 n=1 Tax=Nesidiocoris tenuis TaxID=355587 RepID=A0ABN7ADS0_9HEMI|nr:Phenoloxidase subunit 2 [Nesidiocoris tenuis]